MRILALTLVTLSMLFGTVSYAAETKKVCIDKISKDGKPVMDKKTGKQAQECKEMKVHKKLDGTKVPPK